MRSSTVAFLLCVAVVALLRCSAVYSQEAPTRKEFAARMAQIRVGMNANEAQRTLGKPDDVITHNDPNAIPYEGIKEVWCYGTNGHLGFASLGRVFWDDRDRVKFVVGGSGEPPDPELFAEQDLRGLLRCIDRSPVLLGSTEPYSPLHVIQVVNTLQPLGKRKALAAIDEYLRVTSSLYDFLGGRARVIFVLYVLFDVPEDPGYLPPMHLGFISPIPPKDRRVQPRYPLLLHEDVPFELVVMHVGAGPPPNPLDYIDYFRKHGRMRARPLRPPARPMTLGSVLELQLDVVPQVLLDERHLDHATEVLGGFLESREDSAAFFEPADESFHDVSASIRFFVKAHRACITVFVFLRGNDGRHTQLDNVFVNPISTVSFVAPQGDRPGDRLSVPITQVGVGTFQKRIEYRRLVRLPRR